MKKSLAEISEQTIQRYSSRYEQLGKNIRTLGWGSEQQQHYRFQKTLNHLSLEGKTLLDIGCGFGDYLHFLHTHAVPFRHYHGWDINPNFIAEANQTYREDAKSTFETKNIADIPLQPTADIAIMLGLLNYNLKSSMNNYDYSHTLITQAFSLVNELLIVDFLSDHLTPEYPQEDFVFYHNPGKMLEFALSLSPNVVLYHDYAPIPQKEFMLFIYKA
ncbi:MAG: class I SAM-dependent methyltransferase [Sulfuricurvum sp.]|nr:class I SAM-dependent methyltransferase [Sulfuricurvum sp.]